MRTTLRTATRISGAVAGLEVHLGDEGQRLVRLGLEPPSEAGALGAQLGIAAQDLELVGERRVGAVVADRDGGEPVDLVRRAVFLPRLYLGGGPLYCPAPPALVFFGFFSPRRPGGPATPPHPPGPPPPPGGARPPPPRGPA